MGMARLKADRPSDGAGQRVASGGDGRRSKERWRTAWEAAKEGKKRRGGRRLTERHGDDGNGRRRETAALLRKATRMAARWLPAKMKE